MDADTHGRVGGEGVALDPPARSPSGPGIMASDHGDNSNKIRETSATIGIGGNGDERRVPSQVRQRVALTMRTTERKKKQIRVDRFLASRLSSPKLDHFGSRGIER